MSVYLAKSDKSITAKYNGATDILCEPHDYKKFPGLKKDLRDYARNWKGDGWDDIKVNVEDAEGTSIIVRQPIVQQMGEAQYKSVIIASDKVKNDSSEPIQESIQLKGSFTNSISLTVESEISSEVATEIGGSIEIFSASVSTKISTNMRRGKTQTESKSTEFTRVVNLNVPPNKGFRVKMTAMIEERKISVTLPSQIEGRFRIQYPHPRDGHYYWLSYISAAQRNDHDKSNMVTIVKNGLAISVNTVIEDLEE